MKRFIIIWQDENKHEIALAIYATDEIGAKNFASGMSKALQDFWGKSTIGKPRIEAESTEPPANAK